MTPIGHLAVSYLVSRGGPRLSRPACLLGGPLPDVEFVFLFMPWFNQYHRLLTHNLLFVCLVALLGAILWRRRSIITGASLLLCGALHLFVDSIMDTNPGNGIGVAWFWPFSDAVLSPFNLMQAAKR